MGRFERGGMRDRTHRPWRFDRDNGYGGKYRGDKEQYPRERHEKGEGGAGYKHWNQNGNEGGEMGQWQYNGTGEDVVLL